MHISLFCMCHPLKDNGGACVCDKLILSRQLLVCMNSKMINRVGIWTLLLMYSNYTGCPEMNRTGYNFILLILSLFLRLYTVIIKQIIIVQTKMCVLILSN